MVTDLERFRDQCERLLKGEDVTAALDPLEPELRVAVETVDRLGHLRARVEITPDHLAQAHRMEFDLDQTYLPEIIKACTAVLKEYPVRGRANQKSV